MSALRTVVRAAIARRRLQTLVIGVVALLSTGTVVLAAGLLVVSDAPFDHAFARQSGAHAVAAFDAALASPDALRATGNRPGVTAVAGPFDAVDTLVVDDELRLGSRTVVGRADPGGPVDRLTVQSGQWLTGPGQIVMSGKVSGPIRIGDTVTVGGVALRVVGTAYSVTHTADAWVWPTQSDVLASPYRQMLYRFGSAGADAAVAASLSSATQTLPGRALLGSSTYLVAKRAADSSTAPVVPFVVAFAVLGLVMSVLVVANVVNGAVVAGYRTIGVLKALGFSPGQVVAGYAAQILVPGAVGCFAGTVLGNLLAIPLLAQAGQAYDVTGTGRVAGWVDAIGLCGMLLLIAVAATVPAIRAGVLPAVQAISVGRAPGTGRGYRIRRAIAAVPVPFPVRYGAGTPFARPARTAVTLVAVLLGAVTMVFAAGLSTSLHRVAAAATRTDAVPVEVDPGQPDHPTKAGTVAPQADPASVLAAIRAQPGTARVDAVGSLDVRIAGYTDPVTVEHYDGDPSWVGLPLISGTWYSGPDQVVAGSGLLRLTGHRVGDTVVLSTDQGRRTVRIVGEAFDLDERGLVLLAGTGTVAGLAPTTDPDWYAVGLSPGTDPVAYQRSLSQRLGDTAAVALREQQDTSQTFAILLTLVGTLTLLLSTVSALGVFNTVVLNTRERAVEIGVLKTLGMTPRQVRVAVVTSMAGIGLVAGALALPIGTLLHHRVLPVMADAAGTAIPAGFVHAYAAWELAGLGTAGVVLAALGALVPAGWAARARIATAMRAE